MTASLTHRLSWRRHRGKWTCSLGHRGARVRLFENRNGTYYRDVWMAGRKDRKSLKTRDRDEAERLGLELLGELIGRSRLNQGPVTLGRLWRQFSSTCKDWLDNAETSKEGDTRSAAILIAFCGADLDVSLLNGDRQAEFVEARRRGGILLPKGQVTGPVRMRTVQADLNLLHQMLRWGASVKQVDGGTLLERNPLAGVKVPRERNERRAVATWERYEATRRVLCEMIGERRLDDPVRDALLATDLALVLAEGTGRRLGAIRNLRWEDIDLTHGVITWRAESDKTKKQWTIPLPKKLCRELRRARTRVGAISGWLFPAVKDSARPMDRHLLDKWLRNAEERAGLPKLAGGLWHPYRRKWATERKHLPLKDVMAAGGWTDAKTLLKCYQQADRATLLRVMSEPKKLTEAL